MNWFVGPFFFLVSSYSSSFSELNLSAERDSMADETFMLLNNNLCKCEKKVECFQSKLLPENPFFIVFTRGTTLQL